MDFEHAPQVDANGLLLRVTPDNVLQMHNAIAAEAKLIILETRQAILDVPMEPLAQDSISTTFFPRFNDKINKVVSPGIEYGERLQQVADQIAVMARSYGHTEDEITTSFAQFNRDYQMRYRTPAHPGPR